MAGRSVARTVDELAVWMGMSMAAKWVATLGGAMAALKGWLLAVQWVV